MFEDDINDIQMPSQLACDEVSRFLKSDIDWDLLYLGMAPDIFSECATKINGFTMIKKVKSLLTHAYVASRSWMKTVQLLDWDSMTSVINDIDRLYAMNKKAYAIIPTWFYQNISPSDIDSSKVGFLFAKGLAIFKCIYVEWINIPLIYIFWFLLISVLIVLIILLIMTFRQHRH